MAKRYSGSLQINVVYDDKGHYRTSVSSGGKSLWRGIVKPAPAGFGPGIGYDSPKAYDEIASSAIAFANDEVGGVGDEAEFDDEMTDYLIRRSPRAKSAAHATKRSELRVGDCVVMRDPHRKFITSSTGGSHFKIVEKDGVAITIEGPLDWHPKHWKRHVMGAQQFKKVKCQGEHHSTKRSPAQLDREIAEAIGRRR